MPQRFCDVTDDSGVCSVFDIFKIGLGPSSLALPRPPWNRASMKSAAVIEVMRQTGIDMQSKYKETSQGGLAVNVVAC